MQWPMSGRSYLILKGLKEDCTNYLGNVNKMDIFLDKYKLTPWQEQTEKNLNDCTTVKEIGSGIKILPIKKTLAPG